MDRYKVTADNIGIVSEDMACRDQADEIRPGDETWGILYQPGNQRGQMTRYANGRGAVCFGGYSEWGEWEERDGECVLVLDERTPEGDDIVYDEDGDRVEPI